jgi:hypothetical protein
MSTVKITQLPENSPTTNTANTILVGVDLESSVTGKYTLADIFAMSDAFAQAAYLKANTPSVVANSAFITANAAFDAGNTTHTLATTTETFAVAAYDSQNTTATFANAAFVVANASYVAQNTTASFANGAFTKANSGFATGNSAASFANAAFVTANSGASFANAAFVTANSGASFANASFNKANTSLQNTSSITVNTDLTVPGSLTINGPLYAANTITTPDIFPNSQTAITLSFTNSSFVKANIAADLVVSPSNFVPGKTINLIITNTSGQQRTITHGCTAINSTIGATSFNLGATRTAHLRYFSFDGDLANTYVSATYQ